MKTLRYIAATIAMVAAMLLSGLGGDCDGACVQPTLEPTDHYVPANGSQALMLLDLGSTP